MGDAGPGRGQVLPWRAAAADGGEPLRSPGGLSLLPSMDAMLFCGMNLKDLGLQLYEDKTILFHPELHTYHLSTN